MHERSLWLELDGDDDVAVGPTHQEKEKKANADLAAAASLATCPYALIRPGSGWANSYVDGS
jgi:hypothetical protein